MCPIDQLEVHQKRLNYWGSIWSTYRDHNGGTSPCRMQWVTKVEAPIADQVPITDQ